MTAPDSRQQWFWATAFLLLLGAVFLIYWPGLDGPFLLDDEENLKHLGLHGGVRDWDSLVLYLTREVSALGRPISFLSFLLADNVWPSDPEAFKYQNLMLHLLTGALMTWLFLLLGRISKLSEPAAQAVAVAAAGLWMLHPLFVSTVLYVVQRMAILSSLFMVAGMLVYVAGRMKVARGQRGWGYGLMTTSMVLFFPLALLSKENGALLPLLLLVLELTMLRVLVRPGVEKSLRVWHAAFLAFPLICLVGYFAVVWERVVLAGYGMRPFSLMERLLSQARILIEYLGLVFIPKAQTSGLYHDNFLLSKDLFTPPTTLLAVGLIAIGLIFALWIRTRWPVLSLAILFYFGGHLIESSFFPLELYFEHRNYLPTMFIFFAVAYYAIQAAKNHFRFVIIGFTLLLSMLGGLTYARTALWGDFMMLSMVWVEENPDSVRTRQQAAMLWETHGDERRALAHIVVARDVDPTSAILPLQALLLQCKLDEVQDEDIQLAVQGIRQNRYAKIVYRNLEQLVGLSFRSSCSGLVATDLLELVEAAQERLAETWEVGLLQDLHYLHARILLEDGHPNAAVAKFEHTLGLVPRVDLAMQIAALLATHGSHEEALGFLDRADYLYGNDSPSQSLRATLRKAGKDYKEEIDILRRRITEDMNYERDTLEVLF